HALHDKHVKAYGDGDPSSTDYEKECQVCHKVELKDKSRLVYELDAAFETLPLRKAAHQGCVGCHVRRTAKEEKAGPVDSCGACHKPLEPSRVTDRPESARRRRDLPDSTVIEVAGARLSGVSFLHDVHEKVTSSCRTCHHQGMTKCSSCHTLEGDQKGGGIRLAKAYHEPFSEHSCVGCHEALSRTDARCAGCHGAVARGPRESSCAVCHARERPPTSEVAIPVSLADKDKVVIGTGEGRFAPVEYAHRVVLEKLLQTARKSRLARRFHSEKPFACTACHHHSGFTPASTPKCTSCHGRRDREHLERPGALGAFHWQCNGCHERMEVKKEGKPYGCEDCHRRSEG
ncbi:cytochrome c3 family protein, partial [Planctomycetota bacterium]